MVDRDIKYELKPLPKADLVGDDCVRRALHFFRHWSSRPAPLTPGVYDLRLPPSLGRGKAARCAALACPQHHPHAVRQSQAGIHLAQQSTEHCLKTLKLRRRAGICVRRDGGPASSYLLFYRQAVSSVIEAGSVHACGFGGNKPSEYVSALVGVCNRVCGLCVFGERWLPD
jgi:hypothetical protein